jgi:hypothetical protein
MNDKLHKSATLCRPLCSIYNLNQDLMQRLNTAQLLNSWKLQCVDLCPAHFTTCSCKRSVVPWRHLLCRLLISTLMGMTSAVSVWRTLTSLGNTIQVPKQLTKFRQHSNGATSTGYRKKGKPELRTTPWRRNNKWRYTWLDRNFDIKWRWLISFKPQPLCLRGKNPSTFYSLISVKPAWKPVGNKLAVSLKNGLLDKLKNYDIVSFPTIFFAKATWN